MIMCCLSNQDDVLRWMMNCVSKGGGVVWGDGGGTDVSCDLQTKMMFFGG